MLASAEPVIDPVGPFGYSDCHLNFTIPEIKKKINDWLYDNFNGIVQSGPFIGMKVPYDDVWRDGSLGTQIIGCYEQELHRFIEAEIVRLSALRCPKIVDIGCANGYYAVGLSCRVPAASVWIIDNNPAALEVATNAATANGRVLVCDQTVAETLENVDFILCDCEGAETLYLDPKRHPDVLKATIIVECHDFSDQKTTQIMCDMFGPTHCMVEVRTGPRHPAGYPFLYAWHQTTQWLAVDEGRPCVMRWLVMRPIEGLEEYGT